MSNKEIWVSRKEVLRTPATRGEYNLYRGWTTPEDENPADTGYLVEYLDGGTPNDPRHKGYISWSPKEIFDRNYVLKTEPKHTKAFSNNYDGTIGSDRFTYKTGFLKFNSRVSILEILRSEGSSNKEHKGQADSLYEILVTDLLLEDGAVYSREDGFETKPFESNLSPHNSVDFELVTALDLGSGPIRFHLDRDTNILTSVYNETLITGFKIKVMFKL